MQTAFEHGAWGMIEDWMLSSWIEGVFFSCLHLAENKM
jgi:hypothetical protein